jgi:putative DNA primase/helicase
MTVSHSQASIKPSHADSVASAADFLRRRFGAAPAKLFVLVWTKMGAIMRSHWLPVSELAKCEARFTQLCTREAGDVYVGVALSPEDYGPSKRCEADAVAGIVGLQADIDVKGEAHKQANLPETMEQARELVRSLGLEPTEEIDSGHGLQVWWLFDKPWIFRDGANLQKAAKLARDVHKLLQSKAKEKGWTLDNVSDLARILRLPGSWNCKTADPVPVQVLQANGPRYEPGDFLALIPPETPPAAALNGQTTNAVSVLERARRYVAKMPSAVSGQGGHPATWAVAQVLLRGFALSVDEARPLMGEYNARCQPPWSEKELEHKLTDADQKSRLPRGYLLNGDGGHGRKGKGGGPGCGPTGDGEEESVDYHLTDLGNAKRLVAKHGNDLRFCHSWGEWLVWNGQFWAVDSTGEAERRAKDTIKGLYEEAAKEFAAASDLLKKCDNEEQKAQLQARCKKAEKLVAWALKSESAKLIGWMLGLARSEPGIPIESSEMDRDPYLLNVKNGTIDLRTGQLRPHRREDLLTKMAPVHHDPDAPCPRWLEFLDRVMGANNNLIGYLQRVLGYSLTANVSEQVLWLFHGTGANGKSTFTSTVEALLGDYALQAVPELLLAKTHESHPCERADLFGRRFVATVEIDQGKRLAESLTKQLTGGDTVNARWMKQNFFQFAPTFKIVLAANHKPIIVGTDKAIWRRIKLVPWTVEIPDDEKDKTLLEKLKTELPGILNWAIRGCLDWQEYGLAEPKEVKDATELYQAEQDSVAGFIRECCFVHRDAKAKASKLFEAYQSWSGDKLMKPHDFGQRLRDKGYQSKRGRGGSYFYHGIALTETETACQGEAG